MLDYKKLYEESQAKIAALEFRLQQLERLIFAAKSERFIPSANGDQLNLFHNIEDQALPEPKKETISYEREKKKHKGRNELPEHFPVEEIIVEPKEDVTGLKEIGREVTEKVHYTPASLIKKRYIRIKYAKPDAQGIVIATLPSFTFPKLMAENSLLTFIIVNKFVNHLPFYRQRQIFKRDHRWDLSDSTINDWFIAVCTILEPLYEKLLEKVLKTNYLQADESPIKVLDKDKKGATHQGYMWVYNNPESQSLVFDYRKGRGYHGPKTVLAQYEGALQTDGYRVYQKVAKHLPITRLACWAHVRRKFFEAKNNEPQKAEYALNVIREIYQIERQFKNEKIEDRKASLEPIFSTFKIWLETEYNQALPKSGFGKAIRYALGQWEGLENILTEDRYQLDNNWIENSIRPLALGRKNYLFAGSHKAAQRIAMIYSFFGSCKIQDINPSEWLLKTLDQIADHPISQIEELLPGYNK